ncbi:MAG: hypothetical protein EZS28_001391 [Streblomastix strix]|uniref:Uncharacterized protein n=1 Tax=Streblomastix strix TaxID=222440 RepID=A0A5J4X760_9EUKA|nr:MAG: hypothetical protein EZS28_001391 [Streblomastix strix]
MADADLHSLDALIIHVEILFGSTRQNTIGLVEQIKNINNQINNINNAPVPDAYTRPETNEIFDSKADKSDTYTKTETDTLLDAKADKTDTYTKTETDTVLDDKADKSELIDSYSKIEDDTNLDEKVEKTNLDDYDELTSAQTIIGQKQFCVINISNLSKYGKNDSSIPHAGGGDMLVNSLITQP